MSSSKIVSYGESFANWFTKDAPNPNELTGAIMGGPDRFDNFVDKRWDSSKTEPCTHQQRSLLLRAPSSTLVEVKIRSSSAISMHREHAPAIAAASSTAPTTGSKCKPAAAVEGTLISFPPLLKQQLPASATPLHFQQQPTLLSSGSMDFRDLSSSHCEQQQLFVLSHGCRYRSSALAPTRPRERRNREEKEERQRRFVQRLPDRQPPASPASTSSCQKTPTAIAPFSSKTAQPPHHFHFSFLPQTSTTHNADLPLISTGPPPSLTVSLTPLSATPLFSFENQRDLPDSHKSSPLSRFSFNRLAAALLRPTSTRPSPLSAASPPPPDHQRHPPTAAAPPQQHPISPQLKNPATTTAAAEQSQRQRPLLSCFPLHCWPPETEERKEMTDLQRGHRRREKGIGEEAITAPNAAQISWRRVNPRAASDGGAWEDAPPAFSCPENAPSTVSVVQKDGDSTGDFVD
ncbi:hypothetical protein NC653_039404 [Populus alba x Populus x berolinensis]|uniref:cellulase n=1 Tax=Populus alba x Populus x berolinensis TaxID=444605 RepID=A0AAD6LB48_9ROSI|nr:hypothetical protein NC653_039404 [Populus alba x Populus x berolinensis]